MDYSKLSIQEIKCGYRYDGETGAYTCNYCGMAFQDGQVYAVGENFYLPERAVSAHVGDKHGGCTERLINADTKYNTLTDNQRDLLTLFATDMTDSDIAKKLGLSQSTVRHHKFAFREKAKQAKLYLAAFEQVFEGRPKTDDSIIPIHDSAAYYDERYVITEKERGHILQTAFSSLEPLKLSRFSSKEKKKVVILAKIAEQFKAGRDYTEKEVNELLKEIYGDYAEIRRYLVMYGFMNRTDGGTRYWLAV